MTFSESFWESIGGYKYPDNNYTTNYPYELLLYDFGYNCHCLLLLSDNLTGFYLSSTLDEGMASIGGFDSEQQLLDLVNALKRK
jgi:hypothetical protein